MIAISVYTVNTVNNVYVIADSFLHCEILCSGNSMRAVTQLSDEGPLFVVVRHSKQVTTRPVARHVQGMREQGPCLLRAPATEITTERQMFSSLGKGHEVIIPFIPFTILSFY